MLIGEILYEEVGYFWCYDWEDQCVEVLVSGLLDLVVGCCVEMVCDIVIYFDYWIGWCEVGIVWIFDVLESEVKCGLEIDMMGVLIIVIVVSYFDFCFLEFDW